MAKKEILVKTVKDYLRASNEVTVEDYYGLAQKIYDDFDLAAHNKGNGYQTTTFPLLNEKIEGLEEGLYIFAGESNSGKTAIMTNILWSYCMNPDNKLFGIYYSLDDNTNEVIPRLIAMNQRIPISVGSKPNRYENYLAEHRNTDNAEEEARCAEFSEYLRKREEGLRQLREANERFLLLDRSSISNLDQLIDHAKKVQNYVKSFDSENNIIIAIDSLADLTIDGKFNSDKERIDKVSMKIKEAANCTLKVPIFTSYHVRKLNHQGRPTLDDIKESSRIVYEASVAFLVFNDVSKNKQAASVYYTTPDDNEKHPIIELDWAKNKKSSFKGRTYHYFTPNFSYVTEVSREEGLKYDARIYTK